MRRRQDNARHDPKGMRFSALGRGKLRARNYLSLRKTGREAGARLYHATRQPAGTGGGRCRRGERASAWVEERAGPRGRPRKWGGFMLPRVAGRGNLHFLKLRFKKYRAVYTASCDV